MEERDKYLSEAMGECWHEFTLDDPHLKPVDGSYGICKCGYRINYLHFHKHLKYNPNFSTWDRFGKLWEWANRQKWWKMFLCFGVYGDYMNGVQNLIETENINPDIFADAIYNYLKETSSESSNISG